MRPFVSGLLLLGLALVGCSSEPPPPAPSPSPAPPRPAVQRQAAVPGQVSATPEGAPVNLGPATYNAKDRRDPFRPLVEPPREETALDIGGYKLAGIVWQRKQYFALLETPDGLGHILKVNDRLGPNARVKAISKDTVVIEMKDESARSSGQVRVIKLELKQKEKKEEK